MRTTELLSQMRLRLTTTEPHLSDYLTIIEQFLVLDQEIMQTGSIPEQWLTAAEEQRSDKTRKST